MASAGDQDLGWAILLAIALVAAPLAARSARYRARLRSWGEPAVAAAAVLGLFAMGIRRKPRRELKFGPSFEAPRCVGPSARLGVSQADVLPGHSRWIAKGSGKPIELPFARLSSGISVLGEKGSGKSRLLFALHDAIRASHPRVPILIHDPKGEWHRTYYDAKTDLYFAPHFKGSAAWALWRDFRAAPELTHELLTTTVYAHPDPSGSFWLDQAVELLEAAATFETFHLAARYLARFAREHADDKFALSVFGTAKLGFLDLAKTELMGAASERPAMGIDDFLRWPGRILLLNDPSCASQQRGAFSLFLSAFLLRALSMPDVPAGTLRAVAILDEALTFHLPPDVDRRIYTLCRSKGVCIIAGAQRLPDARNGERGEWQHSDYTFAMRVVDQATQRALSARAGNLIFSETQTSRSTGGAGGSRTESEQDARLEAIPAEHFGRLSPRDFVLFHDGGLVSGRTLDVVRAQRELPRPPFDSREDVRAVSLQLLSGNS